MAAVKIIKFLGEAPKISPELLPDSSAQLTVNAKLYSGDLIPYRAPVIITNSGRNGEVKTLHILHDPVTNDPVFLSWNQEVDVALGAASSDNEQRFYYTGDGVPKVSNYKLATTGGLPYPRDYYELGLPLPTTVVTPTAAALPNAIISSCVRDTSDTVTATTSAAHGLRSGNVASITGFTAGEIGFNAVNAKVTVLSSTQFSYFSPGNAATSTQTTGKVTLAGNTIPRSYVYTWMTGWGEESIASDPSTTLYIKDGQIVTVTNIPTGKPAGKNFVRGVRLYRTLANLNDTAYYRLATLWFPTSLARVSRSSGTSRVQLSNPHRLGVGDRFKISGCTDTTFNITDGIVTDVIDDETFEYSQAGSNVADKSETAGTLYHDVSETSSSAARYWGDGSYSFIDDFDTSNLFDLLSTNDYDPPPSDLQGIVVAQNSIYVGFTGNQVYFSEPDKPHAWPAKYALTFEDNVVGVVAVMGYILVLTEGYPYQVSGNSPATMVFNRIDTPYPCLSKRSIVNMGYGAAYASHGGIAVYAPNAGMDLVTKLVHDWDTWLEALDPTTVVATFYNGKYHASHSRGAFVFERDERIGGFFVQTQYKFSATVVDSLTNKLYFAADTTGSIYQWDNPTQPLSPLEWKSKVIVTKDYMNLGAARVIADYDVPDDEIDIINAYNETVPIYNAPLWAELLQLGTVNGPHDYINDALERVNVPGSFNSMMVNGDPVTIYKKPLPVALPVVFRLWVNKQLVFQGVLYNSEIFRLPSGYRSDTFEVAVSGSARIRAIHIGETPYGLRTA
jgi:hypothetical protein